MRSITLDQLNAKNACVEQLKLFADLFGTEVTPTLELCIKHAQQFDWGWAASNLLSLAAVKAYDEAVATARKAYDEAVATARKAYDEAVATAREAYDEAVATARKAYDEAVATAREAYCEAVAPAWKAYDEAVATAWFNAWEQDNG